MNRKFDAVREGWKILSRTFRLGHREHADTRQLQILRSMNIGGLCTDDEVAELFAVEDHEVEDAIDKVLQCRSGELIFKMACG